MFSKIQKKLLGIKCTVDIIEYEGDIIIIKGWLFSEKKDIRNVHILFECKKKSYAEDITYGINRLDVFRAVRHENARKSGFYGQYIVDGMKEVKIWVAFCIDGKKYKICLGEAKSKLNINEKLPPRVSLVDLSNQGIDILEIADRCEKYAFSFPEKFYSECIDIIIPVYNGYQFLDKLLESISLTQMKYRLILINDKSTDERVYSFLEKYAEGKDNVILLNNDENQGFVRTVNRGFGISENHIALVNTDVELPEMWLERLMLPILTDNMVASSTPYTNCGTICSFPEFAKDNGLFMGLDVSEIDKEFLKIPPIYQKMPTGVGFCMGVNREVMKEIGDFDAESFGKGYGEENDWCQRAIEKGYKNVHVENLFVYHKHGGSFLSEEKKRFLKEHEKMLLAKHPYYNKDVARYCTLDPNKHIREFVKLNLLHKNKEFDTIMAIDHSLGGGATKYLNEKKEQMLKEGKAFVIARFDLIKEVYGFVFFYQDFEIKFYVKNAEDFIKILKYISVNEIWINEMVTYPALYDILRGIKKYALENKVNIRMLVHDFFAVCPTINLLNWEGKYCGVPNYDVCNKCLKNVTLSQSLKYGSMRQWRREWQEFLESCKEVVVFSNDSKNIVEKAFGKLDNIIVQPHQIAFIPQIEKKYKTTASLNIGLLGMLTEHKGRTLVRQLVNLIEKENLNIKIILIGSATKKIKSPVFRETGKYTRGSIPRLILENDIDAFLIPSIWPETFSYTTEEIMTMGMPVMCFDIGAPAERVRLYDKGVIIPKISPEAVLKTLKREKQILECMNKKLSTRRVLFVVEEITFSSRYRVEHLQEQLIQKGIASQCCSIDDAYKQDLSKYNSVVVYRSSIVEKTQKLVKQAHKLGKRVYYDMDDYIFEYDKISNLKFLQGKDYVDFENYSNNIQKSMLTCDGYIVSTFSLKDAVCRCFPDKPVVINRNVASMEMLTISVAESRKTSGDIVKLGYFSGSKTHDEDFNRIKNAILTVMQENSNVHLVVGGQIELPPEFNKVKERVERFEFVSWKKLPSLIAGVDINLMPLEETFFHECKSENKWMEAALVKVPTIATWNCELASVIEDGITGYLCRQSDEWEQVLRSLIGSRELRVEIAENAHKRVRDRYTTNYVEQEVIDLLVR